MRERERRVLAASVAEAMYNLWELESQQQEPNLDSKMCRLKDLSAYSLTHAEIMDQWEGVELLALGMYFGATSDPQFHNNQERLKSLSQDTIEYQGQSEIIEEEIANRKADKKEKREKGEDNPAQMQLL